MYIWCCKVKNTGLLISTSDYPIAEECRPNTRPLADTAIDHSPALRIDIGGPPQTITALP